MYQENEQLTNYFKASVDEIEYQTLSVNAFNGRTYWQKPHGTIKGAREHAFRYTKKPSDFFIYAVTGREIKLVKTIKHRGI